MSLENSKVYPKDNMPNREQYRRIKISQFRSLMVEVNSSQRDPNLSANERIFRDRLLVKTQFAIRGDLILSGLSPEQAEVEMGLKQKASLK